MPQRRKTAIRLFRSGKHAGRRIAAWARRKGSWRERVRRWEAVEQQGPISAKRARTLRRKHLLWGWVRWARAEQRRIRRHHRPRPSTPGAPGDAWGGSQAAGERVVVNVAQDYGLYISSRKRSASDPLSISNPSSDHNEANKTAYAWDIATFNGATPAHKIAQDLGIRGYSTGNYNTYIVHRPWGTYRVQILWAVSGHFNHIHVGIRRV